MTDRTVRAGVTGKRRVGHSVKLFLTRGIVARYRLLGERLHVLCVFAVVRSPRAHGINDQNRRYVIKHVNVLSDDTSALVRRSFGDFSWSDRWSRSGVTEQRNGAEEKTAP